LSEPTVSPPPCDNAEEEEGGDVQRTLVLRSSSRVHSLIPRAMYLRPSVHGSLVRLCARRIPRLGIVTLPGKSPSLFLGGHSPLPSLSSWPSSDSLLSSPRFLSGRKEGRIRFNSWSTPSCDDATEHSSASRPRFFFGVETSIAEV